MVKDVEDLEVYQRSLKLLSYIYRLASLLPTDARDIKWQITKAANSIPPLITEGFAKKRSLAEFKRFLEMALGSSDEVITHLRVIKSLKFSNIKEITCDALIRNYKIVSKQLQQTIKTWK